MFAESLSRDINQDEVPQDGVGTIVLMFAWPAACFTLLIYVVGRQFIPVGGTTPSWLQLLIVYRFVSSVPIIIVLCLLYLRQRRLLPIHVIHWAGNVIGIIMLMIMPAAEGS